MGVFLLKILRVAFGNCVFIAGLGFFGICDENLMMKFKDQSEIL